ncbi:MAG: hypothetical protein K0R75_1593 [Paenibacillaceae bacterium]|nr:hypothetical protein [Paenibacillaceae bacterium]
MTWLTTWLKAHKTRTVIIVLLIALIALIAANLQIDKLETGGTPVAEAKGAAAPKVAKGLDELPKDADFKVVAQSDTLILKLDAKTGHFIAEDKRNGNVWRSYPDPNQWLTETQDGVWRNHLRAPVMLQYIDLSGNKSQPKETDLIQENGAVKDVEMIPNGFKVTFDMPSKEFTIPVEVTIDHDSVVTKIIDSGVKEGKLSLVWMRVYPFFAAEHSEGQDGYMVIPDGSGALINFKNNKMNVNRIYREPIYGEDFSFKINVFDPSRHQIIMPIFGEKSDDKGFIAVAETGAEFAEIIASPSGVYSDYNWITAQQDYRSSFKQITNEHKGTFFITYNKDERFGSDRVVRYILLDKSKASYVGMAERYRQYLMENDGLKKIVPKEDKVPMTISLIGADSEDGLISDRYLKTTTTSDAMQIVQRLYGLGVDNMVVKVPVYLETNYALNNTNNDGFSPRHTGMRDMAGTVIDDVVSLKWVEHIIDRDLKNFKELGVDGVTLTDLGEWLDSDFNTKYGSARDESRQLQQDIFKKFKDTLGNVRGFQSNFYTLPYVNTIDHLTGDYSYDLFSDMAIPFAQMALHGLVAYNEEYTNDRQQYRNDFLHAIEYGANPGFILTAQNSDDYKYAHGLHIYSSNAADWESDIVQEYQKFNEALGDVQDQFIVNHQTLAEKVKETTYENGKRIIVNYGLTPFRQGNITVGAQDYVVIKGGK